MAGGNQIGSAPVTMSGGQSHDGRARAADEIDYQIFGHEEVVVSNDLARAVSSEVPAAAEVQRVEALLRRHGLDQVRAEDA